MPIPRTIIPSSGAVSFGDVNVAIEWARGRADTYLYGSSIYGNSLRGSWNVDLGIQMVASDNFDGTANYYITTTDNIGQTVPDYQVDVNVTAQSPYMVVYDTFLASTINSFTLNRTISAGNTITVTFLHNYSLDCSAYPTWDCYLTGVTYVTSTSVTQSGTAVNENAPFSMSSFLGKSRYRTYVATCYAC